MSKTLPLLLMTSALALAACSGKSKDDVASASTTPANPRAGGTERPARSRQSRPSAACR